MGHEQTILKWGAHTQDTTQSQVTCLNVLASKAYKGLKQMKPVNTNHQTKQVTLSSCQLTNVYRDHIIDGKLRLIPTSHNGPVQRVNFRMEHNVQNGRTYIAQPISASQPPECDPTFAEKPISSVKPICTIHYNSIKIWYNLNSKQ
jgi:hypothetical protein